MDVPLDVSAAMRRYLEEGRVNFGPLPLEARAYPIENRRNPYMGNLRIDEILTPAAINRIHEALRVDGDTSIYRGLLARNAPLFGGGSLRIPTSNDASPPREIDPHSYKGVATDKTEKIILCSDLKCPCHEWKPGTATKFLDVKAYRYHQERSKSAKNTWEYSLSICDEHPEFLRGMNLLVSFLNEEQLKTIDKEYYIDVKGGQTGKLYRIYFGSSQNIYEFVNEFETVNHCVTGDGCYGDIVLMQKILIETMEDTFRELSNTDDKWTPNGIVNRYE